MSLLVLKLREVNSRFADSGMLMRNSTMSIMSTRKTKSKDLRLKKYGKDVAYVRLALKAVKTLPRMKIREKMLGLVLTNELVHGDVTELEVVWRKVIKSFSCKSPVHQKQLLVLFLSKHLRDFFICKKMSVELKKNMSKNSQFNFRLIHSMSFNEENEITSLKNQVVSVIKSIFQDILKTNFDDDTLLLAILQLGSVGNFSEDVLKMCFKKMMDMEKTTAPN